MLEVAALAIATSIGLTTGIEPLMSGRERVRLPRSVACEQLDRNAGSQRRTEGQPRAAHFEEHGVPRIDHADAGALTESKRAETACFVGRARNIDDGRSASSGTRRERTGAPSGSDWLNCRKRGGCGHGVVR